MIRLIALDMDGTLLIHGVTGIPERNAQVLRQAAQQGVQLALCTGRTTEDASFFASDAGLDMQILGLNGGYCLDAPHGSCSADHPMTEAQARALARMMAAFPTLQCGLFGGEELVLNLPREVGIDWGTHLARAGAKTVVNREMAGLEHLLARGVNKLVAIRLQADGALERLRDMIAAELPGLDISSSWDNNIEVMPHGVNKGMALAELAGRLGIPREQVMAIGDHDNDVSMLRWAGCGIAMANGSPAALAAADDVTLSNDRFGVAEAVKRHVLQGGTVA